MKEHYTLIECANEKLSLRCKMYFTLFDLNLVDCEWSNWIIGQCSKSCGAGFRRRTRSPKIESQNGGKDCDGRSTVFENCYLSECPGNVTIVRFTHEPQQRFFTYQFQFGIIL